MTRVGTTHYNYNKLPTFHGGDVLDAIVNYIEKYSSQVLFIQIGFLLIIGAIFVWVWYYNRKKYNHLKHQIPASVVKSYLDSIIQNSTALKSSLFRGGGLDVDPNNIPSVMPVSDLPSGASANIDTQELSALRAQVAQLQGQLEEKSSIVRDLENAKTSLEGEVKQKQARIEELEKLLAEAPKGGAGESDVKLAEVAAERDRLKETLAQYEVIEDDLANLKRLKQENEQLRNALNNSGGSVDTATAEPVVESTPEPEPEPEPVAEEPVEEEPVEEEPAEEEPVAEASAEEGEAKEVEEKSPEDLLSEFEKMLG